MSAVEVTPLPLGRVVLPDFHPATPGFDDIHGFLVRDGDECVLVDTGVGAGNELIERLYRPERVALPVALAAAGASLEDVTAVVNSHLHFDHCGGNALLAEVPVYVQRAELEAARRAHYTVREWFDFPGAWLVPVEGRHALTPRLELVPTPGHTAGHQSLLVHSESGVEVVVAQAAWSVGEFRRFGELEAGHPVLRQDLERNATWSEESYAASLASLHRLRPRRAWLSHDSAVWQAGER